MKGEPQCGITSPADHSKMLQGSVEYDSKSADWRVRYARTINRIARNSTGKKAQEVCIEWLVSLPHDADQQHEGWLARPPKNADFPSCF